MKKPKPKPIQLQDFDLLRLAVDEYMNDLWHGDYSDDDAADYAEHIFETAVEAIYGSGIFDAINARTDEIDEAQAQE